MSASECPDCRPSPWWNILDSGAFLTRDHCGDFPPALIVAWIIPSVLLCVAYTVIAFKKYTLWKHSDNTDYPRGSSLVISLFFIGCGGGHLMNALAFYWPAYRLFILWDWYTLIVSILGVFGMYRIVKWQEDHLVRENAELKLKLAIADAHLSLHPSERDKGKS